MKQQWDGIERRNQPRAEAEALVCNLSPDEKTANPAKILLHELLVHKVELEILRRA